jgi:esterase
MPILTLDDTHLAYSDTGAGAPPLLFVHGFGGDRSDFVHQVEAFRGRHRVVALDRRGHGESGPRREGRSIADDADDIARACRELALYKPVLVVHSQGGIGLEVAARHPDLLSALVLLDPPMFAPPPVREQFQGALGGLRSPAWRDVIRGLADHVAFLPADDAAVKAHVVDRMLRMDPAVLADTWRAYLEHDAEALLPRCTVPLLILRSTMPCDEAQILAARADTWIGKVVGAGHFAHALVPEQVNAMITALALRAG